MNKQDLRKEVFQCLKSMRWVPQDPDKYLDAVDVETDTLMRLIEQYAQQGKEDNARR